MAKGVALAILGAVSAMYGYTQVSSLEYRLAAALGAAPGNVAVVQAALYGGIVALIIGIVIIVRHAKNG